MFAFIGVSLLVPGEENSWSHRPAVFNNHRNDVDPYVADKLVHRDWGSVVKTELVGPFRGLAQCFAPNVAYVDRSSTENALEALGPVADLLRPGVSILIAPAAGAGGGLDRGGARPAPRRGGGSLPSRVRPSSW